MQRVTNCYICLDSLIVPTDSVPCWISDVQFQVLKACRYHKQCGRQSFYKRYQPPKRCFYCRSLTQYPGNRTDMKISSQYGDLVYRL